MDAVRGLEPCCANGTADLGVPREHHTLSTRSECVFPHEHPASFHGQGGALDASMVSINEADARPSDPSSPVALADERQHARGSTDASHHTPTAAEPTGEKLRNSRGQRAEQPKAPGTAEWAVSTETEELLEILQWPGVGPAKVRALLRAAGPGASIRELANARLAANSSSSAKGIAEEILDRCHGLGLRVLSLRDELYPVRLRQVDDAPPIIYVRGNVSALHGPSVAVVGTREASTSGLRAARAIASYLARRKVCVVSGLALGIDAAAHEGALSAAGITVAVLAHGLHMVAPTTNRAIAERLLAHGGALVSEHPPGVPPRPAEFVRRNRIQSGLSLCSIVVESGVPGGAVHQARFTRDQGRPLLVVLPSDGAKSDLRLDGARHMIANMQALAIRGTAELGKALQEIARDSARTNLADDDQAEFGWA